MGRKKGFFDKRNSVTYSLIHTSAPAGQQSERLWVEKSRGITVGSPDPAGAGQVQSDSVGGLPPGHPLAWLSEGPETALTDAQRRETVDLGLPDDGYDYLQHLRDPRLSYAASAENQAEPSVVQGSAVFVPAFKQNLPEDDVKVFQSFRLQLRAAAENEEEAGQALPGVTAFSREVSSLWTKNEEELAELRKAMLQAEAADGSADEFNEVLDDFLLTATKGPTDLDPTSDYAEAVELANTGSSKPVAAADSAWDSASSDRSASSSSSSTEAVAQAVNQPTGPESIVSAHTRPDRTDRSSGLSALDDRFEHLALGYNSDDMGELDDEDEAVRGAHDLDQYEAVMDEFLSTHATHDHAHEGGQQYDVHAPGSIQQDLDVAVAIAKAREHLQAAEQRSEPAAHAASHWGEEDSPRERWDCESVLTALSNLDNHPGKITEPPRSKQGPKQRIHLSAKSGLPVRHAEPAQGGEQQAGPGVGQLRHPAMPRRQGETPEQKRERKAAVKDARRQSRAMKKELKVLFKDEAQRHRQPGAAVSTIQLE